MVFFKIKNIFYIKHFLKIIIITKFNFFYHFHINILNRKKNNYFNINKKFLNMCNIKISGQYLKF